MPDPLEQVAAALADRYRVERVVGRGGMATVYGAQDLKHGRRVAIKVLHPELAAAVGAERFITEIRTTATLQHPNILPLFDSGEAAGIVFYVMPFVEGESLRERLTREQQLPVDEAIRLTQQIASALEHAHRRGVIHRDIKPENILLSEGQPLVADFGIAFAVTSVGGTRLTQSGISVGTPQYMSPEQAAAEREVDRRTDIYALGAVLYEMLAGQPPFVGPTAAAITARKMTEAVPPLRTIRDTVPGAIEAAVRKALSRTPADRFATAQQFADALELARSLASSVAVSEDSRAAPAVRGPRPRMPWIIAACAIAGAAAWVFVDHAVRQNGGAAAVEFALAVEPLAVSMHGSAPVVAFSPDGRQLAYVSGSAGDGQLYLRRLDRREAIAVPGVTRATGPFFSPDGQWIAYADATDQSLRKVRVTGGAPIKLCKAEHFHGGTWGRRGKIAFSAYEPGRGIGIRTVSEDGGASQYLVGPDTSGHEEAWLTYPSFLPDDRWVLYSTLDRNALARNIAVVDIETGNHRIVADKGGLARYVAPGYLVYAQDGELFAARFNAHTARMTGKPVVVRPDVMMNLPMEYGLGHFDISSTGTLAYLAGPQFERLGDGLAWSDRSGRLTRLPDLGIPREQLGLHSGIRVSPDGRRLLVSGMTGPLPNYKGYPFGSALYLYDLARASLTRLAPDKPGVWIAKWLPDGQHIVAMISEDSVAAVSLFMLRADGLGAPERLTRAPPGRYDVPWSVTADGSRLFYFQHSGGSAFDVWVVPLSGDRRPQAVLNSPTVDERYPAISPDGRWLAYVSNESGEAEVYLTDYPSRTHRWQVSSGGGDEPAWNSNGRELFFARRQGQESLGLSVWAVSVSTGAAEPLGKQALLFENDSLFYQTIVNSYDPASGGTRFLVMLSRSLSRMSIDHLAVVVNWTTELRAAVH